MGCREVLPAHCMWILREPAMVAEVKNQLLVDVRAGGRRTAAAVDSNSFVLALKLALGQQMGGFDGAPLGVDRHRTGPGQRRTST